MSPNFKKFFSSPTNRVLSAITAFSLVVGVAGGVAAVNSNLFKNESQNAKASSSPLPLAPGRNAIITIPYDNVSDAPYVGRGTLNIRVSERFELVAGSIKDTYAGNTTCVNDSATGGIRKSVTGFSQIYTLIDYTPTSATTPGIRATGSNASPCASGNGVAGGVQDITLSIPPASVDPSVSSTYRGQLEFLVRLKADVLDRTYGGFTSKIGDIIATDPFNNTLGIYGTAVFPALGRQPAPVDQPVQIGGILLDNSKLGNGSCNPGTSPNPSLLVSAITTCTFPIIPAIDANNPFIIPGDIAVKINGATNSVGKAECVVNNSNLVCSNVPSVGAAAGNSVPVNITSNSNTAQKATIVLVDPTLKNSDISNINCQSVVAGQPSNCTVNLNTSGPYIIPSGFSVKIGNAPATVCTTTGNVTSNSFVCNAVSTTGAAAGSNNVITNLGPEVKGTVNLTPNENEVIGDNITSAVCNPVDLRIAGNPNKTTCTANLNATNLIGTIAFKLQNSDIQGGCNATVALGSNIASCEITPTLPGVAIPVRATASGRGPVKDAGVVNVRKYIVQGDVPNIGKGPNDISDPFQSWQCANNNTAISGQTDYSCLGVLKPGYDLPLEGFKVGVGVNPSGTCVQTGSAVSCTGVPVTTNTGSQPLKGQIGSQTPVNTSLNIQVNPDPNAGLIYWLNPESTIAYNYTKSNPPIYNVQDATVTITAPDDIRPGTCQFSLTKYGSTAPADSLAITPTINGKTCTFTLTKAQQTFWFWEGNVRLTDTTGKQWGRFFTVILKRGAFAFVTVSATPVN